MPYRTSWLSLCLLTILSGCSNSSVKDLGVDVYPGATKNANSGASANSESQTMGIVTYTTPDDQAKVAQFYKERYPDAEPMEMSFGGDQISVFTKEDAKTRMGITVVRKKGEAQTTIKILVGKQDEK